MNNLSDSIKATLAYFSLFNHPLTSFEIHKWLYCSKPATLKEINQELGQLTEFVGENQGFFFLNGGENGAAQRLRNYFDNQKKIKIARRAAGAVSWLPWWRLVAVTNTVALEQARSASDIDWLVVVKPGRLWTARFLLTAWLWLLGQWRHGEQVADKICLSFFLTEDSLDLSSLALPGGDVYLTYWPTQLIPLLAVDGAWPKFLAKNSWIKKYLSNFDFDYLVSDRRSLEPRASLLFIKNILEKILANRLGEKLEELLRALQLVKMSRREKSRQSETSTAVVVSDQMLKFHEIDRRAEFNKKWLTLING